MPTRSEAEENLRVIRSLMEKATIYRAISAEAAAVGGALAIGGSFVLGSWLNRTAESYPKSEANPWSFIAVWLVILALSGAANLFFLHRQAKRRGAPLFSPGMRLAVRSLAPSFLIAGLATYAFAQWKHWFVMIVPIWCICYGLALLSTQTFAPPSLKWLGWAFLVAGILGVQPAFTAAWGGVYKIPDGYKGEVWRSWECVYAAQQLMALTFGLLHLIYAACTWRRKSTDSESGAAP